MSDHALERRLANWLVDGPHDAPAEVVARALAEARTVPQARVITLPWTHLPRLTLPRPQALATAMSVAIVVCAVAFGLWSLQNQLLPPATSPSPTAALLPTASPTHAPSPAPTVAPPPPATPATTPEPAPTGTASALPAEPGATPAVVATIEGDVIGLLSFESGYVAYGYVDESDGEGPTWSAAWFSADGREWEEAPLARQCPGSAVEMPDAEARAGATDGRRVVLVGWLLDGGTGCDPDRRQSIAWFSDDGRTWTRSAGFGDAYEVDQVWWADGGWEALTGISPRPIPNVLWRSEDGLNWRQIATVLPADEDREKAQPVRGAAAPDGRRVLAIDEVNTLTNQLLSSVDGVTWQVLDGFTSERRADGVELLLAPTLDGADRWLVIHDSSAGSSVWVSQDLADWRQTRSPLDNVTAGVWTSHGYVVAGFADCFYPEDECPAAPRQPWEREVVIASSGDGLDWQPVTPPYDRTRRIVALADGPGGVLAMTQRTSTSDVVNVYRLALTP